MREFQKCPPKATTEIQQSGVLRGKGALPQQNERYPRPECVRVFTKRSQNACYPGVRLRV